MIEFDDAGGGCPLLGEIFIARKVETNEYRVIHLKHRKNSEIHLYKMLVSLKAEKDDEEIVLCRGDVFDNFHKYLLKRKFNVRRGKIEGLTNDLAEDHFTRLLRTHGVPESIKLEGKDYGTFYNEILVWYYTLYKGPHLIKRSRRLKRKRNFRDFTHNPIYHFPNLVAQLCDIKGEVKDADECLV